MSTQLDLTTRIFASQAQIHQRTLSSELVALAKQRAPDPTIFEELEPYAWDNEISSTRIDAYFTHMDAETTLANYAAEAARGVAFLAGHNSRVLPFGSTLTGVRETLQDGTVRVLASAYTLKGLTLGGVSTSDFVAGARSGIIRDVSIGFYGGQWICSVCGRDMLTDWWDCWHVPGLNYEVKDASNGVTTVRDLLCTALVKDAHLAEVSAVYDGATPGAGILYAELAAEAGRITAHQARLIESRYRIHLPDRRFLTSGTAVPTPAEEPMPPEKETSTPAEERTPPAAEPAPAPSPELTEIRALVERDVPEGERPTLAAGVRWLTAERERLIPLADEGTTYRADMIKEALEEGVRANGETFAMETYRSVLQASSLETIKRFRSDWQAQADKLFPTGRQSRDSGGEPPVTEPETPPDRVPAAYKA